MKHQDETFQTYTKYFYIATQWQLSSVSFRVIRNPFSNNLQYEQIRNLYFPSTDSFLWNSYKWNGTMSLFLKRFLIQINKISIFSHNSNFYPYKFLNSTKHLKKEFIIKERRNVYIPPHRSHRIHRNEILQSNFFPEKTNVHLSPAYLLNSRFVNKQIQ